MKFTKAECETIFHALNLAIRDTRAGIDHENESMKELNEELRDRVGRFAILRDRIATEFRWMPPRKSPTDLPSAGGEDANRERG